MKYFYSLAFCMLILVGCQSDNTTENIIVENVEDVEIAPSHVAIMEVEGMMCEKGCGSIIRKGLYETGGVSIVEFDFEEDRPRNEIKVFFDIHKVSTEEMIEVISNIANNQYSAKLIGVTESTISEDETLDLHS